MKVCSDSLGLRPGPFLGRKHLVLIGLLFCLMLGSGLRFYKIGAKSLTSDEILTLSQSYDLTDVIHFRRDSEISWLPVQFVALHLALLLGRQEFVLRFPALLAGILTLPLIYLLGSRMFGDLAGLIALFLFAISPLHIFYSQYLRFYPYLILFTLLSYYLLYEALSRSRLWTWFGLALSMSLTLRTQHVASVVWIMLTLIGSLILALDTVKLTIPNILNRFGLKLARVRAVSRPGFGRLKRRWLSLILSFCFIALLSYEHRHAIFYNISVVIRSRLWPEVPSNQLPLFPVPGPEVYPPVRLSVATLVSLLDSFSDGNWYNKIRLDDLYLFIGFCLVGGVAIALRRQWKQAIVLGFTFAMPLAAIGIMKIETAYGLEARYLSFLLPFYFILIGYGIVALSDFAGHITARLFTVKKFTSAGQLAPWLPWGTTALFMVIPLSLFGNLSYYSLRTWYVYEAQNWRDTIKLLATAAQVDECILLRPSTILDYYRWPGYTACPSSDLSTLLDHYGGIWYVHLNDRGDKPLIAEDQGFATVQFDGYWGSGIEVSYVRPDQLQGYLSHRLAAQAVAISPSDPSLRVDLAQTYLALGRVDLALEAYKHAVQLRPDYQPGYEAMIKYYLDQGETAQAESWLKAASANNRHSVWPYLLGGQAYIDRRMYLTAMVELKQAVKLAPFETYSPTSYSKLAQLYRQLGRPQAVIALYQQAARYNPDESWSHFKLAEAFQAYDEPASAVAQYQQAISLDPTTPAAYEALASIYRASNEPQGVVEVYQQAARANPNSTWPLIGLGDWYRNRGDTAAALTAYTRAHRLKPADLYLRQRLQTTEWNLGSHLDDVVVFSSKYRKLAGGYHQIWFKPYPAEPATLVSASPLPVGRQVHPGQVFFHPFSKTEPTYITFAVPENPYLALETSFGLADEVAGRSNGVSYQIEISADGGQTFSSLFQVSVADSRLLSQTVSLVPYWKKDVIFKLTSDAQGDDTYDWLLISLQLQSQPDTWNLVDNAWQGSGRCGMASLKFKPQGYLFQDRLLVSRSISPVQEITLSSQVGLRPCNASVATTLYFPVKHSPFMTLKTVYGLADQATGQSNGVGYSLAISTATRLDPIPLLNVQVSEACWQTRYLDLSPYLGQDITLIVGVSALGDDQADLLLVDLDLFPLSLTADRSVAKNIDPIPVPQFDQNQASDLRSIRSEPAFNLNKPSRNY